MSLNPAIVVWNVLRTRALGLSVGIPRWVGFEYVLQVM